MLVLEEADRIDEMVAYRCKGDVTLVLFGAEFPDFVRFCHCLNPEDVVFVRRSVCIEGSCGNDTSVFIDDTFVLDGSKLPVFG